MDFYHSRNQGIIINMKGQILSRIQSYQSIRNKSINKQQEEQTSFKQAKMNNHDGMSKFLNLTKKSYRDSYRMGSLGPSSSAKKNYNVLSMDPFRKSMNRTKIQEIKRSINYEREPIGTSDPPSNKYFMLPKKMSHKQFNIQEIRSLYPKGYENEPNRQNTIGYQNQEISSQRSLARIKNIQSSKDLGQTKITNRKDFMKVFNRKHYSKQYLPISGAASQKNIELDKKMIEELYNNNKVNKLARTTGIFQKEKKLTPYFQLSNKKIKQPSESPPAMKDGQELEQNVSQLKLDQEEDVSIEISLDQNGEEEKLNSIQEEQEMELSCSRIEEAQIENDSSFLGASQRSLLATMEQLRQKRAKRGGKTWKKLPSDFLKS